MLRLKSGLGSLFPEAQRSRWPRSWIAATYFAGAAAITLCVLARQPGVAATSSFWAEDGQILYQATLLHPFLTTITTPYDGYLELVPRVAIWATHLFSVADASAVAAVVGDLILAFSALVVFHAARGYLHSAFSRCVLVAAMVVLPVANGELLNDIINTPWWLLFATFWVLLWRPATRWERVLAALVCFATAASTPVAAFYLPIAVARFVTMPRVKDQAPTIGLLAGLLVQLPAVLLATPGGSAYPKSTSHIASLFLLRVGSGSVTGVALTNTLIEHASSFGIVLGAVVFINVILFVVACRSLRFYLFGAVTLTLCVVLFAYELWYRGGGLWMNDQPAIVGGRYVALPLLLLISTAIVAADNWRAQIAGHRVALGMILITICLAPTWVRDFQTGNWRSTGPDWPAEVAAARASCATPSSPAVNIATAPAGWSVAVPCDRLR
jgi:hypothetical protein